MNDRKGTGQVAPINEDRRGGGTEDRRTESNQALLSSYGFADERTDRDRRDGPEDEKSLYARLGGYDVLVVAVDNILARLMADDLLGRFWQNRGNDGIARERQLLIDYLASAAGGPMLYSGREMKLSHEGMGITEADWIRFFIHVAAALDALGVNEPERGDVLGFIGGLKGEIVD